MSYHKATLTKDWSFDQMVILFCDIARDIALLRAMRNDRIYYGKIEPSAERDRQYVMWIPERREEPVSLGMTDLFRQPISHNQEVRFWETRDPNSDFETFKVIAVE